MIYSFVLRYAVRDLFFVSIMSETTKTGDIEQDHNIIQDQPNPGRNLETRAKITQKKRSWTWDYFEEVDIKEQTSDKGEPLKRCKLTDTKGNKCGTLYINDGSTGNAINHLLNEHEISKEGKLDKVNIFFILKFLIFLCSFVKYFNKKKIFLFYIESNNSSCCY